MSRAEPYRRLPRGFTVSTLEVPVSDSDSSNKHWSDQKADAVAVLTILVSCVLFALHFISNPV